MICSVCVYLGPVYRNLGLNNLAEWASSLNLISNLIRWSWSWLCVCVSSSSRWGVCSEAEGQGSQWGAGPGPQWHDYTVAALTSSLFLHPVWTLLLLLLLFCSIPQWYQGLEHSRNVMCWIQPPFSKLYLCYTALVILQKVKLLLTQSVMFVCWFTQWMFSLYSNILANLFPPLHLK